MKLLAEIESLEKQADYFPSKVKRMNKRPKRPMRPGGLRKNKPRRKKSPMSQPMQTSTHSTTSQSSGSSMSSGIGFEIEAMLKSL